MTIDTRVVTRPTTRADHVTEVLPLNALDGTALTLVHIRGRYPATRGPVLLLHGAGVRAELFRPPSPRTLVDALLDEGWDVWLLNWRASIDLRPNPWTLDQAAVYDHPAAVQFILQTTGAQRLKAIVHCQGSTSFTMAAISGLVPQVDTVITNSVSLHPVVPGYSMIKMGRLAPVLGRLVPYVSPAWGDKPSGLLSRAIVAVVRATHRECDNSVCRMVSFSYGTGWPALWSHDNIDEQTHDWISGEFGPCPMTFYAQMARSDRAGHLVPVDHLPELPPSFVVGPPQTDARFVFLTGENNRCFLPESQQRSYDFFAKHRPGRDTLHRLPGYGHLDVIFGREAWKDTYPLILEELAQAC
jgi:hypothetical protein